MHPYSDISSRFQQLLELDPSLSNSLDGAATIDQAVALTTESADRHGLSINPETLRAYLQAETATAGTDLNDESLAGVSGGWIGAGKRLSDWKRRYMNKS